MAYNGYPPLVTPYSQYVKNVALGNVILGIKGKEKWGLLDDNTWDMLLGKSGKLPGSLGAEINNLALKSNKSFYYDEPQNLYPDKLEDLKIEMKEKGWALGKDNEELLEFALHKNQYIDYKSGKAKESFNQLIDKSKKTLIKDDNSDSKNHKVNSTIIELDDSKYKVEAFGYIFINISAFKFFISIFSCSQNDIIWATGIPQSPMCISVTTLFPIISFNLFKLLPILRDLR